MNGLNGLNNRLGGIKTLGGVQGLSGVKGLGGLDNDISFGGLNGVQGLSGLTGLNGIKGASADIGVQGPVGIDESESILGQDRYSGRFGVNYGGAVGYGAGTVGYKPTQQGLNTIAGSYYNTAQTLGGYSAGKW